MTEDEMIGWHHRRDGYEFEQALGVGDGQGGLAQGQPKGKAEIPVVTRECRHNQIGRAHV